MNYSFFSSRSTKTQRPALAVMMMCLLLWAMPVSATKVLLIGDSLSSGYGLSGPGWVELANQQFVESNSDIRIVNDSISGDTTAGGLARILDGIRRTTPDWVIIELGGNDGLRGIHPAVIEENLRRMVEIARLNGVRPLMFGIRIPPNYGKVYTKRFEQVFTNVSQGTRTPLLPFYLEEVALNPGYMQPDNIHPNDQAQPLIRDHVVPLLLAVLKG